MILPVLSGEDLLNDIRSARLDPGELCIWWLGQSGYVLKTASATWIVDPYLSESLTAKYAATEKPHIRMTQAPLRGGDIDFAGWVFASHTHTDHFDAETLVPLFAASPNARLVLPSVLVEKAVRFELNRERIVPTRGDETLTCGPLIVHVLPSAHPTFEHDPATGYPYVGFVFEVDGLRLYHSGDTVVYEGLAQRLQALQPDILFLPINGAAMHGGKPVVAANMNADEAIALRESVGHGVVIPHHYDMFTFNTADVNAFADHAREAHSPYALMRPGCPWRFRKP
jgi:L-ascorbate metabolism protein UlaG (beta-lactamase superfamily)